MLRPFGRFLEKRFISDEDETLFIHKVKVTDTDPAIAALEKETAYLLYHTAAFALEAFNKKVTFPDQVKITRSFASKKLMEKYDYIKHQHGEIYNYIAALQRQVNDKEITIRLLQLIDAARNTMYAAKNIKDAWPDIEQLSKSSKDQKYNYYLLTGERVTSFFEKIIPLVFEIKTKNLFEKITVIYKFIQENYKQMLAELHREDLHKNLTELEFSTIINFNREIFTCEKSVAFAVKGLLLTGEEAAHFDELPGFIR